MATTQEYSQLSLYVYDAENDAKKRPNVPEGWEQLEYQINATVTIAYKAYTGV